MDSAAWVAAAVFALSTIGGLVYWCGQTSQKLDQILGFNHATTKTLKEHGERLDKHDRDIAIIRTKVK